MIDIYLIATANTGFMEYDERSKAVRKSIRISLSKLSEGLPLQHTESHSLIIHHDTLSDS